VATITNLNVSILRNVANADVTVTYDLFWSDFDQLTNLEYIEKLDLIGDDTNQDGDNPPAGSSTRTARAASTRRCPPSAARSADSIRPRTPSEGCARSAR
jgi:hypothetical protein